MNYYQRLCLFIVVCFSSTIHAEEWGNLKGKFIWDGEMPKLEPYQVTSDVKCCGKEIPNESLLVDPKTKGIANVLIYVRSQKDISIHPDYQQQAKEPVTISIKKCRYTPHLATLQLSQTLKVKNLDECAHNSNIFPFGDIPAGPVIAPTSELSRQFKKAQRIPVPISCNIHPWMRGYVLPLSHPYFAVTKTDGSFELKNLPVGEWEFQVWHETAGYLAAKEEWERGRFTVNIEHQKSTDLGTIKVNSELFNLAK